MMDILINRFTDDEDSTVSQLYIDGKFECFTLEDEYRERKVAGKTRIPAGKYKVGVRYVGGFHNRYNKRFPRIHLGMLQILHVPDFEYILFHCGNTDADTAGCILTGAGCDITKGDMKLYRSVDAYTAFYSKVIHAALDGYLSVRILDNVPRRSFYGMA